MLSWTKYTNMFIPLHIIFYNTCNGPERLFKEFMNKIKSIKLIPIISGIVRHFPLIAPICLYQCEYYYTTFLCKTAFITVF